MVMDNNDEYMIPRFNMIFKYIIVIFKFPNGKAFHFKW
jgi:hypothetical protein